MMFTAALRTFPAAGNGAPVSVPTPAAPARPTDTAKLRTGPFIDADIVYTQRDGGRHHGLMPVPGRPETQWSHPHEPHRMQVRNGRDIADTFSLDRSGFVLRHRPTRVGAFMNQDVVRTFYYPEIEALLKAETGASRVLIFDHTTRRTGGSGNAERPGRLPVHRVHVDYTERSAPQRVRDLVSPAEADRLLQGRVMQVNVWRPIKGPVVNSPLAVLEADSLGPGDLIETDLIYPDRTGEIYGLGHRDSHRWVWFPEMDVDEVLLLKSYDSLTDGRARFTPHSAFTDPTAPDNAPPRESIEVRSFLFFD